VIEGREQLREMRRTVLWEGAPDITFTCAELAMDPVSRAQFR
jgi:hypothetical protein